MCSASFCCSRMAHAYGVAQEPEDIRIGQRDDRDVSVLLAAVLLLIDGVV